MSSTVLVLDFDGVICDSIDESFLSSWIAYFHLYLGRRPSYMAVSLRRDFSRLRPLVRGGADFMLIQEILEKGLSVSGQEQFDALAHEAGEQRLRLFHDLFYQARSELLKEDRTSWLALNRVYPHVLSAFEMLSPKASVFILSTKKPEFIAEILSARNIGFPRERILYSGSEKKLDMVAGICAQGEFARALFVDDQIDHLAYCDPTQKKLIGVFLASWGYVKEEWLSEPRRVPVITPEGLLALVRREFA